MQHSQLDKKGDSPIIFNKGAASLWILWAVLDSRIWKGHLKLSRGGQQIWWKSWKTCPVRRGWGYLGCPLWREGGQEMTSLISAASWGTGEWGASLFPLVTGDRIYGNGTELNLMIFVGSFQVKNSILFFRIKLYLREH